MTESPSVASNAYGSNSHASRAPSSSLSFKGIVSVNVISGFYFIDFYMCLRAAELWSCGNIWVKALNISMHFDQRRWILY